MRAALISMVLLVGAVSAFAQAVTPAPAPAPKPFEVNRGSAIPPPAEAARAGQTAPPEGATAGGVDFGQWRSADPEIYGNGFQAQMRTRFAGRDRAAAKTDLEANGFRCAEGGGALQCRIEIMEAQCAKDWYVVFEQRSAEPVAGFDVMCLGARSSRS